MKKSFLAFIVFCGMNLPALFAAEEMALKPVVLTPEAQNQAANTFSLTVTGSGKMIPKPGPVFTGGHYDKDVQLPYLISTPKPIKYPRWAMRQGWEGKLEIALEILEDGSVGRFKVMKSTGHRLLDAAATDAVRTWKFAPAAKNGKFLLTCIQIPVDFQLQID